MLLIVMAVIIFFVVRSQMEREERQYGVTKPQEVQATEPVQEQEEDADGEYVYVRSDDKHEYEFDENGAMLVPTFKYSEQELAEYEKYEKLADEIQRNGHKLPRRYKTSGIFHAYMVVALWAGFFLFLETFAIFVAGILPTIEKDHWFRTVVMEFFNSIGGPLMVYFGLLCMVFFAIVGVVSVIAWIVFIFSDKNKEQEVIEMMNKTYMIIGISLQKCEEEAKKKMEEELEREKQNYAEALIEHDVASNKVHEQDIKELQKMHKKQIDEMQKDFAREKKLMNFDIKELKMELRKHKALAKELDDSDDVLNGMYN